MTFVYGNSQVYIFSRSLSCSFGHRGLFHDSTGSLGWIPIGKPWRSWFLWSGKISAPCRHTLLIGKKWKTTENIPSLFGSKIFCWGKVSWWTFHEKTPFKNMVFWMMENHHEYIGLETEWIRLTHPIILGVLRIAQKSVTIRHEFFAISVFLEMQCCSERARRAIALPSFWGWNGGWIELKLQTRIRKACLMVLQF